MKRLELLDAARLFAALSVVAFHYFFHGINIGTISTLGYAAGWADVSKYGYLGVEFFFMISGYVIFFSARNRSASEFGVARCVRLFPAFWVAMVFTTFFSRFWGGPHMTVYWPQFVANLTMLPGPLGYAAVDGAYWTLQLELSFYSLVFLFLLAGLRNRLEPLFLAWPFAMLAAAHTGWQGLPYLGGYYTFFAAGALLAVMKERRSPVAWVALGICLHLCLGFSASCADAFSEAKGTRFSLAVVWTVIVAQFLFFLVLNTARGQRLSIPGSRLAGGLTYPLYLIHAYFGYMILSRFADEGNKVWLYGLTCGIVLGVSYAIHRMVERRYAIFWQMLFANTAGVVFGAVEATLGRFAGRFSRQLEAEASAAVIAAQAPEPAAPPQK
ncbi:MAG: acyltransferase family protein [Betaproteobacteria bacterium]